MTFRVRPGVTGASPYLGRAFLTLIAQTGRPMKEPHHGRPVLRYLKDSVV